jgi:hypothetical protein
LFFIFLHFTNWLFIFFQIISFLWIFFLFIAFSFIWDSFPLHLRYFFLFGDYFPLHLTMLQIEKCLERSQFH